MGSRKGAKGAAKALAAKSVSPDDQLSLEERSSLGVKLHASERTVRDQAAELAALRRQVLDLERQLGVAADLRGVDAEAPPLRKRRGKGSQAVACVAFSDWHAEERVDPRVVNGLNEYTLEEFQRRADVAFQKVIRLVETRRRDGVRVESIVVGLLGDFITGLLHDDQRMTNTAGQPEAKRAVKRSLIAGFRLLLEHGQFRRIVVPCVTGNHGRTTKKRLHAADHLTNDELVIYNDLQDTFEGEPRLEILPSLGEHAYTMVFDHEVRWTHGDLIRYQGGIGGLLVPARRRVYQDWNPTRWADTTVMGHHHTLGWDEHLISNGSLIGVTAYSANRFRASEPVQAMWFIDEHGRRKGMEPIYVASPQPSKARRDAARSVQAAIVRRAAS